MNDNQNPGRAFKLGQGFFVAWRGALARRMRKFGTDQWRAPGHCFYLCGLATLRATRSTELTPHLQFLPAAAAERGIVKLDLTPFLGRCV